MNNKLNIPKKIKVGFQKRSDTYTGMLAYVIYFDNKGVLRKEKSWETWRDKTIDAQEFDNEPTSGFVLNRGVGGVRQSYGWNARNEYIRVYDSRGFEFEISVANLLFILQECSAIKGKGLEGEFVYAWNGTKLALLPVSSQEFKESTEFCELQTKKITSGDMVVGCTYLTKDREEVLYMGRLIWYDFKDIPVKKTYKDSYGNERTRTFNYRKISGEKKHIFIKLIEALKNNDARFWVQDGFTKLSKRTSENPIPQFADEFDKLNKTGYLSKPVRIVAVPISMKSINKGYGNTLCVEADGKYYIGSCSRSNYYEKDTPNKYVISCYISAEMKDGEYFEDREGYYGNSTGYVYHKENLSLEEVKAIAKELDLECENGVKRKITE